MPRRGKTYDRQQGYVLRMMATLALSLAVVTAAVRWWPPPGAAEPPEIVYDPRGQELIVMEEIVQTQQRLRRPPPPAPLVPVVVPDEVVLDEYDLEVRDSYLPVDTPGDDAEQVEGDPEGTRATAVSATVGPKPVRIVEPEYTREARRKKVRAEVVVEVLVNERGRVEQARIVERYLLGDRPEDPKQPVPRLGYGLEEAALAAAEGWMFRPARQNGKPVSSLFTFTLSFGI
ncbi:energy transducer TonB [Rhodocaloribacter litoris]|uniref:energy transducer TonB n=1 Tax=Rhodocaloribacter litoris TaxID=2558931 RepID=UPI0014206A5A|nr:energy transducer TonB [Rhodocaloribacter litoris]QXD14215.1 energy transducer TonB [Rhodocaloribacter litoris]GIV59910.1 MAG: hypothetical protein KatS3mg043_0999 [Rhodothermaceae bacterium]